MLLATLIFIYNNLLSIMNSQVTMHPFPRPLPEEASVFGGTRAEKTYAARSHSYGLGAGLSTTKSQPTEPGR